MIIGVPGTSERNR